MTTAIDFVTNAKLPPVPQALTHLADTIRPVPAAAEGAPAGFVDWRNLVSFVAGISKNSQADVLNSTLFAQAVATARFDAEHDTENWYKVYRDALQNIGWQTQNFQFEHISTGGGTVTVDKVVIDILASITSSDEMRVAKAIISSMKSLDQGDGRLKLWESSSHTSNQGNFGLMPVAISGGIIIMKMAAFYFSCKKEVKSLLWLSSSSEDITMYKSTQVVNLNDSVYSQVRDLIVTRLGIHAKTYVQDVPLSF